MPATSVAQQKAMGIAHAAQQGKIRIKPNTPSADIAKSMKPSDVKDFASTSHKGLPNKVDEFKFYTVLTPQSYEQKPQELVQQHTPFSFAQAGHQPEMVHSFHMEEDPAMGCAYDMVKELYEAATALEEKKELVSSKLQKEIDRLHKEASNAMNLARKEPEQADAHRGHSSALLEKIKHLEAKYKTVSGSKKEIKPLEELKTKNSPKKEDKKDKKEK
jgi:hypothetical protein